MITAFRLALIPVFASPAVLSSEMAHEDVQISVLDVLDHELDSGLSALVTRARADKTPAPQIHSEWYVSESGRIPAGELALERQKRQFGRRLLEILDETSDEILAMTDSPSRERIATTLLDLGDWIAERPGYGNVFIFERCQDMATVPLAHLIADLDYPEAKLDALTARLRTWADMGRLSANALNSEAPDPRFVAGQGETVSDIQRPLAQTWGVGLKRARNWLKTSGATRSIPEGKDIRTTLPADMRFFCDDDMPVVSGTTLDWWDFKRHFALVNGFPRTNVRHLRSFLLFRRKVGRFPTEPPAWWKPGDAFFDTPIKAAFDEAWEPYRREFGPVYATAASVYVAALNNTFYDRDTTAKRIQQAASASRPASGRPPAGRGPGPGTYMPPRPGAWGETPVMANPAQDARLVQLTTTRASSQPTSRPAGASTRIELTTKIRSTQPAAQPTTEPSNAATK